MLYGRSQPIAMIDALLAGARAGSSGALVLHGEAGIGKSALLSYARSQASHMTVLEASGHEAEIEFAFSMLDQVVGSLAGLLPRLPDVQEDALRGALQLSSEPVHDRFLVSAGLLSLLAEVAEERPVLCLIDDVQWADRGSADALGFAARRVRAEGIVMLFAMRTEDGHDFRNQGIPDIALDRLGRQDSERLVREQVPEAGAEVVDRLVTSSCGNPLALVEFPALAGASTAGGPVTALLPLRAGIHAAFLQRVRRLSSGAQSVLLIAAADPAARYADVVAVAGQLRVNDPPGALAEAENSGLVYMSEQDVVFRHPLVRAAIYQDVSSVTRRRVHDAFATSLAGGANDERRAWHLSLAATGPDENVAAALERSAKSSRARGAVEATSWALEWAANLSEEPAAAAWRMAAAADASRLAGQPERARTLIEKAAQLSDGEGLRIELDYLRGVVEERHGVAATAFGYFMSAADRISDRDPARAVHMATMAVEAAYYAGDVASVITAGARAAELTTAVPGQKGMASLVALGCTGVLLGDADEGRDLCREATELASLASDPDSMLWGAIAAGFAGDALAQQSLATRALELFRAMGQVSLLPSGLDMLTEAQMSLSRFAAARASADEGLSLAREFSQQTSIAEHLSKLAKIDAVEGDSDACRARAEEALTIASTHGLGLRAAHANWALGLLELALGNPDQALFRLRKLKAGVGEGHPAVALVATPDLVEAAARSGQPELARSKVEGYDRYAGARGPAWVRALQARSHAVLAADGQADTMFRKALDLHAQAGHPFDRARTELLYGEFLRRSRRRVDARNHLRIAAEEFQRCGAHPWANRAELELRATGVTTKSRESAVRDQLTSQEYQVATLVKTGASNRDVAAQLFLSRRTVEYHLSNVYSKLGVSSRSQMAQLDLDERRPADGLRRERSAPISDRAQLS